MTEPTPSPNLRAHLVRAVAVAALPAERQVAYLRSIGVAVVVD